MNWRFKDWPLKAKFTALTMFISLLGLSLFSGAYALNEYFTARTDIQHELVLLAEATAAEAVGPIAFDDEAQISRLVGQFHDNPAVVAVRLYKANGTVAGEWKRPMAMEHEWPSPELQDTAIYGWEAAHITRGVRLPAGRRLGTLCICSDLKPVKSRMRRTLGALLGLWGICLGVAYFATRYLQGLVVGPITDLAETMQQVTETRNYTQRVSVTSGDEIGRLEVGFNDLLGKVQVSQGELEQRVRERTSELGEMNERLVQEVQKRFRTEEALRQSEQRVNQAVQGSEIGLWEWEPSTQATYFSKEWKAHLGYADHELPNTVETWSNLLHPQDKDRTWQSVNDFINGRAPKYEVEFRLQHKDGSWRWILSRAQMFSDAQSGVLRLIGTHMDITPRKEAERTLNERTVQLAEANAALQRSEEQMGLAVKGSDLGLWDWNIVTGHVTFSERLLGMIGYTVAEVKPHVSSWEELLHPDDKPHVMAVLTAHLEGRTPIYETEHRLKVKGGGWLWVLDRGQVVERDAKGNPLRAAGTHLDINLRKEAERVLSDSHALLEQRVTERTVELATSNERFLQLAENIEEVFWMTEVGTDRMLYVSPAYEQIWGRPCKELYANPRSWLDCIHEEDRKRVLAAAISKQAAGTYNEEYRIRRPDGTARWIRDRAFPVRDGTGKVIRVAGIAEDITAAKLLALRQTRQESALRDLAHAPALHRGNLEVALSSILSTSAAALEVARASCWLYTERGTALRCEQLWNINNNGSGCQPVPGDLRVADFPRYFASLAQERVIAAHDAASDSRTAEFAEPYLKPLGIASMLDAPVRAGGRVAGVLCFEHTGTPRAWTPEEQQFAASVGDLVALALAAKKRREDEEQLHLLAHTLESTREMVAIADPENRFIYANEAFQRGYGYSMSELLGKPTALINPSLSESVMVEIPRQTTAGGWQGELMNRAKDGREFPISLSTSPVFDTAGKLVAMVGVATDISERKRLEREALEAAERERQRIGQDLHDDLCQHLTGIRFKAALVEKKLGADGEKLRDDVAEIIRQLGNATDLARSIARGLQPVDSAPNGLMTALELLAANTSRTFKFSCHCRFPKPVLLHDVSVATHLYRIVQEAVQNAIKHGHAGVIEMLLETRGDRLILTVTDDGAGIHFDKSNGIGLQTMRHRAQLIGGVLQVEPLASGGTQVICSLPHYPPPRAGIKKQEKRIE